MKAFFLPLCLIASTLFLFSKCQKKYDPSITNTTSNFGSLTPGSSWTYSIKHGESLQDTFTLTVSNKDTIINGRTYKVLNSSNGRGNTYLAKIESNYYCFNSFPGISLESFEELYLKDNVPLNSTWVDSTQILATTATANTLIGNWKMDEGNGTTLIDASNYRNNATIRGNPDWVTGVTGQALKLNGTRQYATVPDNATLDIADAITLAAWVKPKELGTQSIIKKAISDSINGYELSLSSAGRVFFRFNQTTSGNTNRINAKGFYPVDGATWMHMAATYDGSVIKLYINGVENSSITLTNPLPINTNDLALAIGAQSNGTSRLTGTIDDARIYNAALDASEIRKFIYSSEADTLTASLIYSVIEKSVSHVVKGKMYSEVTHVRLNIIINSTLNIGGGDFYYADDIGLIENNIEITPPGQSSFTSKQELISYEIK